MNLELKVSAGFGILNSSLDPTLQLLSVDRDNHVDLLKILGHGLQCLLIGVDVTIVGARVRGVDIKVDWLLLGQSRDRILWNDIQLVVFVMIVGSNMTAAAVSSPVHMVSLQGCS